MTPIDQVKIEDIRKYCEKATKGPWTDRLENGNLLVGGGNYLIADPVYDWIAEVQVPINNFPWSKDQAQRNLNFIARSRTDLPRVLDALEASMKEVDACNYLIEHLRSVLTESGKETTMLRTENERLREILRFYADEKNYTLLLLPPPSRTFFNAPIDRDMGDMARQALEPKGGE